MYLTLLHTCFECCGNPPLWLLLSVWLLQHGRPVHLLGDDWPVWRSHSEGFCSRVGLCSWWVHTRTKDMFSDTFSTHTSVSLLLSMGPALVLLKTASSSLFTGFLHDFGIIHRDVKVVHLICHFSVWMYFVYNVIYLFTIHLIIVISFIDGEYLADRER